MITLPSNKTILAAALCAVLLVALSHQSKAASLSAASSANEEPKLYSDVEAIRKNLGK